MTELPQPLVSAYPSTRILQPVLVGLLIILLAGCGRGLASSPSTGLPAGAWASIEEPQTGLTLRYPPPWELQAVPAAEDRPAAH